MSCAANPPTLWPPLLLIISACKLKRSFFPEIRPTLEPYGGIGEAIAKITGIPANTPVFGASDQAMSALGTGLIEPGQASIAISTGGQFLVTAPKGLIDPKRRLHTLNHAFPDIGLYMAATLSAGFSFCCSGQVCPRRNR